MSLFLYKIFSALIIFLISILIAFIPIYRKKSLRHKEGVELGEALASGIFLGAAFLHMLPDAVRTFTATYPAINYPVPEIICVAGFLLMLLLERFSLAVSSESKNAIPYVLAIVLIVHAFIEGLALGIGSTISEALLLCLAIVAHKGSESFALCTTLLRHSVPIKRLIAIVIFFALMSPLGILLGTTTLLSAHYGLAAIFNAFAAGTFLYISTLHHVHFHQHDGERQGLIEFGFLLAGVGMMAVIAVWA